MKTKTNTKTNTTAPAVVPTATAAVGSGFTLGLDFGDRSHYVCVLDAAGQSRHEGPLLNDRAAFALLLTNYPAATVALEAGTHSPWISRHLAGLGAKVFVALTACSTRIPKPGSRPAPGAAGRTRAFGRCA